MKKTVHTEELLKQFRTSDFFLNCRLPIEYTDDFPILHIENETLCMTIPYLKYKLTGQADKTQVFPIRYTVTVTLPEMTVVGFEDFKYNELYKNLDFDKPIGLFRHESVKHMGREEYRRARSELYAMYDKLIAAVLYDEPCSQEETVNFAKQLRVMLEPSQYPIYQAVNSDFFNKYLG